MRADSLLMIKQVEGEFRVKHDRISSRCTPRRRSCSRAYDEVDLQHVRREQNTDADALVNAALDAALPS